MADSNRTAVSVVAILAIVILVGLVVYFVTEEADDDVEVEFNLLNEEAAEQVEGGPGARSPAVPGAGPETGPRAGPLAGPGVASG